MELELTRHWHFETNTISVFYVGEIAECFVLEDKVREVAGKPVSEWKVAGQTAIPEGRYRVLWTFSNRFQRFTLELQNVSGFTGIRIHAGNTAADTEGCLLTGRVADLDGSVSKSKVALAQLEAKIVPIINGGEEVWITVRNRKAA